MKKTWALLLVAALGFALGGNHASRREAERHAAELAAEQAAWDAEKNRLDDALKRARAKTWPEPVPTVVMAPPVAAPSGASPEELLAQLQELPAPAPPAHMRRAVYLLERLAQTGPATLPAIREYLARYEDIEFDAA